MHALETSWLGSVPYGAALQRQLDAVEARRAGGPDRLLLLEHPPVITLGRSTKPENLLASRDALAARGVELHEIARGGDVTYHAPGQLVGYLVADLAARGAPDVSLWLRGIEAALLEALAQLGVPSRRIDGMTGVFVANEAITPARPPQAAAQRAAGERSESARPPQAAAQRVEGERSESARPPQAAAQRAAGERSKSGRPRKIASIGVGLKGWITYHGFALNVSLDLAGFGDIVPCGLGGVTMTSLARELARELALGSAEERAFFESARERVAAAFERALA